jgi:hypothetical protein
MNAKHLGDQRWRNLLAIDFTAWRRGRHARRYTEGR